MLVVIVVLGVVGSVVSSAVISSLKTQRLTQANVVSTSDARTAVERMTRDIRTTNPLRAASANSITFDLYYGTGCERRTYYLSGTSLMLDRATFAAGVRCGSQTATPGAATTVTVIGNVANTTATPLFRYYRWDSVSKTRVEVTAPVASTSLRSVDTVLVDVHVSTPEQGPVALTTLVDLRNVELK
jgi:type II secretory pathway pseudopilin PulG